MRKVIVNADDFGLCRGVNEGIILAHQKGILTSATLMANMPGFEHAVELSRQNKRLGVGVHLNIVRGQPVSPVNKVRSLLNSEDYFFSNVFLILEKLMLRKIHLKEIEREFRAQIEKLLKNNIKISHFDSEKHVHSLPSLFKIIIKLGKEYDIRRIRYINEVCFSLPLIQSFESFFISLSCSFMKKRIKENGIMITDKFYGICHSGRMSSLKIKKILSCLEQGVIEIMVHPGFITQELKGLEKKIGSYYINKYREKELNALLNPELKEIIKERKIHLISFSEL